MLAVVATTVQEENPVFGRVRLPPKSASYFHKNDPQVNVLPFLCILTMFHEICCKNVAVILQTNDTDHNSVEKKQTNF